MTTAYLIGSPKGFCQKGDRKFTRYCFYLHITFFKTALTFLNVFLGKKTIKTEKLQAQQKFSSKRNRGPSCLPNEQCTKPDRPTTSAF